MTPLQRWITALPHFAAVCSLSMLLFTSKPAVALGTSAAMVTVTDLAGRKVQVHTPVERAILGEGRQLYLVAALDTANPIKRIVGWGDDLIQDDPDTYTLYQKVFPRIADIPIIGGFGDGTFDVERAIVLRPDVIFLSIAAQKAAEDAHYIKKLGAAGIPVVYVDFRYHPIENTGPTIRLFGKLLGKQARAEKFIAFRAAQIRRVTETIEAQRPVRPKVFVERAGGYTQDCCLTFGDGNFGKFVEMAGSSNIAKDIVFGTFGQLNPEEVIMADPEHVIITSADWKAYAPGGNWIGVGPGADLAEAQRKLATYTKRPAYTGIKANENRMFHAIWHQFYNNPYQFVAIQQIAKWLHPALFADLDPDATFREFYERFLPIPYKPGYFVTLNGRADTP